MPTIDAPVPYDLTDYDQSDGDTGAPVDQGDDQVDDQAAEVDDQGAEEGTAGPAAPAAPSRQPPKMIERGSGVILGAIAYAIGINYIRGGPTQVRKWLSAKLTNSGAGTGKPDAHALQPNVVPPGFSGPGNQLNIEPPTTLPPKGPGSF